MTTDMKNPVTLIIAIVMALLSTIFPSSLSAQEFSVESFRDLPNDISAFISPVKNLNDEGCALLKVITSSPDYAFSTPLGIVRRIDKTGEIWLYLPRGSKKITIKHARWGVLRDYAFPSKLESHITYELTLNEPARIITAQQSEPIVTTITDTLVVTRVDTLMIIPVKPKIPLDSDISATATLGGKATYLTWGLMATVMKRHGAYLHLSTDFGHTGHLTGECDRYGMVDGSERFYSGHVRRKAFMATAGAIHRTGKHIAIFEGIGYASNTLAWQLAPSEGGGYVRNSYFSHRGVTAEAGIMLKFGRVAVSASAITVKGTEWFGSLGIGIRFGKQANKKP